MKNKAAAFLIFTFWALNTQAAVDDKEIAKCAAIDGDLSRLDCFDSLAKSKNLDGPQTIPTPITDKGAWEVDVRMNPIDDSTTIRLHLTAESGESRWDKPILLIVRCQSNKTDLIMLWHDFLGSDDIEVVVRIGDNRAFPSKWTLSTDNKATFYPKPIALLKQMFHADKFVAQLTPYNENPITAIFNIAGLENAIVPLRETCSW